MDIGLSMRGEKELDAMLRGLQNPNKYVRKGTRAGAKLVKTRTKTHTPVLTGKLKRSWKVRVLPKSVLRKIGGVGHRVMPGTREQLGIPKDAKGYYPSALEFGYTMRNGTVVPPRGFMRRAAAEMETPAIAEIVRAVRAAIETEHLKSKGKG